MFHYDIKILKQVQSMKELSIDTESKRSRNIYSDPKMGSSVRYTRLIWAKSTLFKIISPVICRLKF